MVIFWSRILLGEMLQDRIQIQARGRQGYAGLHSSKYAHRSVTTARDRAIFEKRQRQIVIGCGEEFPAWRCYPDDLIRLAVQSQSAADNPGIGSQFLDPKLVIQHDGIRGARLIIGFGEKAAEHRPSTEESEETAGDEGGARGNRVAPPDEGKASLLVCGHVLKRVIFVSPMLVVDPCHADSGSVAARLAESNHAFGTRVGQRFEQNGA